ncbi:hypothetical protein FNV43_RR05684 [Rhamnella rubrinervis]|uniref:Wall-associated receptor kinase galacturonan-binding domain-containing protein n=1 Tax=Rhamnella rubrinervis TaxID=2594499 RepID=A0A8K0HLR5_9ROSA|nr:hypothetical protein FNV43_RR05684 [Rhamnella rubrinervis]
MGRYNSVSPSLSLYVWRLAFLFLFLSHNTCDAKHNHHCPPSSCGKLHNISKPFRLQDHPNKCGGDKRYTLTCENNRTVLYLYSGKYYVEAINYNNHTIRLVDPSIHKHNCSSIPLYSLNDYNFSRWDPYSTSILMISSESVSSDLRLSESIVYLNCEKPVNSPHFIDTAPCNTNSAYSQSKREYSYVMVYGGIQFPLNVDYPPLRLRLLSVSDLKSSCRIEQMAMITWRNNPTSNTTYLDIHNELLYGFELSWLPSYYKRGRNKGICVYYDSNIVRCQSECVPNGLYRIRSRCSMISNFNLFVLHI